jgi:EamA-like transporter family
LKTVLQSKIPAGGQLVNSRKQFLLMAAFCGAGRSVLRAAPAPLLRRWPRISAANAPKLRERSSIDRRAHEIVWSPDAKRVAFRGEWEPLDKLSGRGLLFLCLSGIATGLSWLCYYRALQMADASKVAPIDKLSVAFVIVITVLFLGEPLTWKVAVGGGLVVAGALVLAL